jgi:SAM-dependent MidA family methyltransferase
LNSLPSPAPEGYIVDLPTGSRALIDQIIQQPWKGIFIALDYGKTWQAITHDSPQGTARAYQHHRQSPNLLENIGQQDLTCHICWDWMEEALSHSGFQSIDLESQESFVLKRASEFVRRVFESDSGMSDPMKGGLRQLIHPSLMGQKFQSLSAIRTEPASRSQSA